MKRVIVGSLLAVAVVLSFSTLSLAVENIDPSSAYALAASDPNVYILDVRSAAEWQWVGHPGKNKAGAGAGLAGKVVNIAYQIDYKGEFVVNPSFLTDVAEIFGSTPNVTLITMCRSGHRSSLSAALLEAAGYRVMNMVTGFEGGTDASGYRTVNGWKMLGLPYSFSGLGAYAD